VECLRRLVDDEKQILDDEDIEHWAKFVEEHPDIIVNKTVLLGFLAARTQTTPPSESPEKGDKQLPDLPQNLQDDDDDEEADVERALQLDDLDMTISQRRSPNEFSDGPYSRPPSRGGGVPATPSSAKSPFDAAQRQRSTPLAAPSAWTAKRPKPAARRKSDAGNPSDSEVGIHCFMTFQ
jgi:hypothetical protein